LSVVFFAPRFAVSRIQTPMAWGRSVLPGRLGGFESPRVRKAIARDLVGNVAGGITVLALAKFAGADVSLDPNSSDFLKIRIGNTRIDIFAGFQQPARVILRIGQAITNKAGITEADNSGISEDFDAIDIINRFAMFKLSPAITVPGELLRGKTIVGQETTPLGTALRSVTPLVYDDIAEAWRDAGFGRAALATGLGFVGVGVNTFADSEGATRRKIRKLMDEGNPAGALGLRLDWNRAHPDNRIVTVKTTRQIERSKR